MAEDFLEKEIVNSDYKVLIVDDVMANVLLLKVLLANAQYHVETANCGRQALEQVKNTNPDLILLDVMMPDMNGFEVAQHLKADSEAKDIPIIFLTALNSTEDIVKGFTVGASDFVNKPFNKDELLIRVKHQISLVAARRIIVRKNQELEASIRGRDKMYSVIAHDLRSPMATVKMVVNMLSLSLTPDQVGVENCELVNQANQQIEEIFSLLDNLLKWTKSQTGRLNVVHQHFAVGECVAGLAEIFQMVAGVKNITLDFQHREEDKLVVFGDVDMCKTIIRNFISNAIKFSNPGSSIEIFTTQKEGYAVVNVRDHGCGISEEDQARLFNSKTHFSKYGTNNEEGSGLGLMLCKDFAQKNGGELWMTSELGVGSTFSFSIPLKNDSQVPL